MAELLEEMATAVKRESRRHDVNDDGNCAACAAVGRFYPYPCPPRVYAVRAAEELARRASRWHLDPPEAST